MREEAKIYNRYKELISLNKKEENLKDVNKEILSLIESDLKKVVASFCFAQFERNVNGEVSKHREPFSFLVSDFEIEHRLSDPSLLSRIRDKIKEKFSEMILTVPILSKESYDSPENVYRTEVLFESYSDTKRNYLFYFNKDDKWMSNHYVDLYKSFIIDLGYLYDKPAINRQINLERFQICSKENFVPENALLETGFNNVKKLLERFIKSVKEGRKIIVDDEIILCHKLAVLQDCITFSQDYMGRSQAKLASGEGSAEDLLHKREEKVKAYISQILRGSVKQNEYIGFFTMDDYIDGIIKKFPEVPKDRLVELFKLVTNPKPPVGVTRFTVPATKETSGFIYFISLEHVPMIFQKFEFDKKKFDQAIHISKRHFLLFLKRLLKDYQSVGYTDAKIANILKCNPDLVVSMKRILAELG